MGADEYLERLEGKVMLKYSKITVYMVSTKLAKNYRLMGPGKHSLHSKLFDKGCDPELKCIFNQNCYLFKITTKMLCCISDFNVQTAHLV